MLSFHPCQFWKWRATVLASVWRATDFYVHKSTCMRLLPLSLSSLSLSLSCLSLCACVFMIFMKHAQMQLTQCRLGSMRSVSIGIMRNFCSERLPEFAQANISQNCMRDTKYMAWPHWDHHEPSPVMRQCGASQHDKTDTTGSTWGGGTQTSYAQSFDCIWRWFPSTLHSKLVFWFLAGCRMHFLQHGVKRPLLPIQHIFDTNLQPRFQCPPICGLSFFWAQASFHNSSCILVMLR